MEFKNSNLIVVENENKIQIESIEELSRKFFGEEYINKNEEEKKKIRYRKMVPYSLMLEKEIGTDLKIENDREFFLSLCKIGQIKILEKKEANIFVTGIDKEKMEGNYILVNIFAEKLLT